MNLFDLYNLRCNSILNFPNIGNLYHYKTLLNISPADLAEQFRSRGSNILSNAPIHEDFPSGRFYVIKVVGLNHSILSHPSNDLRKSFLFANTLNYITVDENGFITKLQSAGRHYSSDQVLSYEIDIKYNPETKMYSYTGDGKCNLYMNGKLIGFTMMYGSISSGLQYEYVSKKHRFSRTIDNSSITRTRLDGKGYIIAYSPAVKLFSSQLGRYVPNPNIITDAVYGKPIILQKFGGTPENPGGLKETWIDCGSFIVRRNNQTGSEEIIDNNYGTSKLLRRDNHIIVNMNGFPDIHKIACAAYNEYMKSRGVTTPDNYDTNILSILNRRNSLGFYRNRDNKITCYYRLPNFTSSYSDFDIVTGSRLNSYYIVTTSTRLTYECSMNIIITDDFEKHLSEIIIDTVLKNGRLTPLVQLFELALSEI